MRVVLVWAAGVSVAAAFTLSHDATSSWVPRLKGVTLAGAENGAEDMVEGAKPTTTKAPRRITRTERRDAILNELVPDTKSVEIILDDGDRDESLVPLIHAIARAADKRKAEDILALEVAHLTMTTEFFVNMVGNSRPQNQAIAAAIEEDVEEEFGRTCRREGSADSGWILLDFGDVIVNVMTPRSRAYYDLESFWKDGKPVDLAGVLLPPPPLTPPGMPGVGSMPGVPTTPGPAAAEEDDLGTDSQDEFWAMDDADGVASAATDDEDPFWS